MDLVVLGNADGGPSLRLDHETFAYAGKFVMTDTGKALLRERGSVIGAAAFNRDRTDESTVRVRYVTVREGSRGEGAGPVLLDRLADRLLSGDGFVEAFTRVRIAVNNPFAYEALHRAGFGWTGRETGVAELVLERPAARPDDPDRATYQAGLDVFRERDLGEPEASFLADRDGADPPDPAEWEAGDG